MFNMYYVETPLRGTHKDVLMLEADKMLNKEEKYWKFGYKQIQVDLLQAKILIRSDYRCYSAGKFKNGSAINTHWIEQDCIIFDIDNGLSLKDAYTLFGKFDGLIATTKSHTEKHNKFRIILPLKNTTTCTAEEYTEAMRFIMDRQYTFLDKQCKDPARIYFGTSKSEFTLLDGGELFDFDIWVEKAKLAKNAEKWAREKAPKPTVQHDGSKADWYRKNWKSEKMLEKLKHSEKFGEGSRNGTLYSWAKYFKEIGLSDTETQDAIYWLNEQGDSIPEKEIRSTIFKSLRIAA